MYLFDRYIPRWVVYVLVPVLLLAIAGGSYTLVRTLAGGSSDSSGPLPPYTPTPAPVPDTSGSGTPSGSTSGTPGPSGSGTPSGSTSGSATPTNSANPTDSPDRTNCGPVPDVTVTIANGDIAAEPPQIVAAAETSLGIRVITDVPITYSVEPIGAGSAVAPTEEDLCFAIPAGNNLTVLFGDTPAFSITVE